MTFRETLSAEDRHLVNRLEAFGDIVVGFSLSQLAFGLAPSGGIALAGTVDYAVFFGTFAVVALFWMRYHRVMSVGFVPRPVDLVLAFAFLAFVALVPYAVRVYIFTRNAHLAPSSTLALYVAVFAGLSLANLLLNVRGARNAWVFLDEPRRARLWRAIVAGGVVFTVLAVALVVNARHGYEAGGMACSAMAICIPLALRTIGRRPPARLFGGQGV